MQLKVTISGVDSLQKELSNVVTRQKISDTLEQAAILVEGEAIYRCPVQFGYLRDSITHRKVSDLTYEIAATAKYADYIEYGTMRIACGTPENPLIYTSSPPGDHYPSYRPFLGSSLYSLIYTIEKMFDNMMDKKE